MWGSWHQPVAFLQSMGGLLHQPFDLQRGTGLPLANIMQPPVLMKKWSIDTMVRHATGSASLECCIPTQGFSNHVLVQWQLWSEGDWDGGRKIHWLQHQENFQIIMPWRHNNAVCTNNNVGLHIQSYSRLNRCGCFEKVYKWKTYSY